MTALWSYDPKTGTYMLGNINPDEMATLVASVCAGFAIVTLDDPFGAEAARQNLRQYIETLGQIQTNRLLEVCFAADTHRIHARRNSVGDSVPDHSAVTPQSRHRVSGPPRRNSRGRE